MKTHENTTSSTDVALNNAINDYLIMNFINIDEFFRKCGELDQHDLAQFVFEIQSLKNAMINYDVNKYTYENLIFAINNNNFLDIEIIG